MLQENLHGRNILRKVIRIDGEVWSELQRRAIPFEDKPNSVLRRLLGLTPNPVIDSNTSAEDSLDPRVPKLLQLVEARVGQRPAVSPTKTGRSHRFKSKEGKIVAFIHQQKHRLNVESSEQMAKRVGIDKWDRWLNKGWWGQDHSVYWQIPTDDDDAYGRAADVLDRLWRQ